VERTKHPENPKMSDGEFFRLGCSTKGTANESKGFIEHVRNGRNKMSQMNLLRI